MHATNSVEYGTDDTLSVLLIEDQAAEAELIDAMLMGGRERAFRLEHVDRLHKGIEEIKRRPFDIVLLDLCLPDSTGIATFETFRAEVANVPVILMTNMKDEQLAARAVREGAQDYLIKREIDAGTLVRCIRYAIERQLSEEALRRSEERYALAVQGSNDGVWDWDLLSGKVYYSPRWKSILGYRPDELSDDIGEWHRRVHPDDAGEFRRALDAHLKTSDGNFDYEYRLLHRDGSYIWVLTRGVAVRTADGAVARMAGSLTDITSRKRAEERLLHDALHDSLTGLPNRTLLLDRMNLALREMKARKSHPFAVLFLDLDRFKNVNDSLGHGVGDELLVEFSRRLAALVRPGDTVARLGGDEFAILLNNIASPGHVTMVARRVLNLAAQRFTINGYEIFASTSIGIALGGTDYDRPDEILRDADIAMYRAKSSGKARYEVFDQQMHHQVVEVLRLETDLRRAVENREFVLHYQPIVALDSGRLVGFESLIRWRHPHQGLISPEVFIPAAEETGLIVPMGWWTIEEACRQTRKWQFQYPQEPPLSISVNVSGKLFTQANMVSRLEEVLANTRLPPRSLRFEITESVLLEHAEEAMEKLAQLRQLGVGLHVDDFGTGYSSLSYLQKFAYDSLKIDRSFVSDIGAANGAATIVETIIGLGKQLGMNIIAEGVETSEQISWLKRFHCPQVQGFWFSRPLAEPAANELLAGSPNWAV